MSVGPGMETASASDNPALLPVIDGPPPKWRPSRALTTTTTEAALNSVAMTTWSAISTHEQLVDENNLRPIWFLEAGLRASRAVCQIVVPGVGTGTGFAVAPSVVMTNHHVLDSPARANGSLARFNYQLDAAQRELPVTTARCRPDRLFWTHPGLDVSLVAVDGDPGIAFGVIPLGGSATISEGDRVNIIQHPLGQPKQLAVVDNQVAFADGALVQYLTDTLPGSSGAPVFDDQWQVVALHHSGGWIPEPNSSSTHFRNEGTAMAAILAELVRVGLAA